jgi:hypothetical protein
MKINSEGGITFTKGDVFIRDYIIFSDKLLNEKHNRWFKEWVTIHSDDELDDDKGKAYMQVSKELCGYLEKQGYTSDDMSVLKIRWKGIDTGDRRKTKFTIIHPKTGQKVKFDHYNGYWYTATETGKDAHLVMFEWGDFYSMGSIFPIVAFCAKGVEYFINGIIRGKSDV